MILWPNQGKRTPGEYMQLILYRSQARDERDKKIVRYNAVKIDGSFLRTVYLGKCKSISQWILSWTIPRAWMLTFILERCIKTALKQGWNIKTVVWHSRGLRQIYMAKLTCWYAVIRTCLLLTVLWCCHSNPANDILGHFGSYLHYYCYYCEVH